MACCLGIAGAPKQSLLEKAVETTWLFTDVGLASIEYARFGLLRTFCASQQAD